MSHYDCKDCGKYYDCKCGSKPIKKPNVVDEVNNPSHYASGDIECIDAIEASMTPEAFKGYLKGNIIKYTWRYEKKINPVQDLEKAQWYQKKLIETEKK